MPALRNLKLVAGLELRGRGDVQLYRVELPGPKVTKDGAADAPVRLMIPREHFNPLATEGHVPQWRKAFELGHARATGLRADPAPDRPGRGAPGGAIAHPPGAPLTG